MLRVRRGDEQTKKPWIVIVTGFGRFPNAYDRDEDNPSNPLAKEVEDELKTRKIPCECVSPVPARWGEIEKVIEEQTNKHKDKRIIWIAFGAGRSFRIELHGDNKKGNGIDIAGNIPGEDGVPKYNSDPKMGAKRRELSQIATKGLFAIQKALQERRIRIARGSHANDYLCESTIYGLHRADRMEVIEVGIFIHTPNKLTPEEQEAFAKALIEALFQESGEPIPGRLIP